MNPLQYWYDTNQELRETWDSYYDAHIAMVEDNEDLHQKILALYHSETTNISGKSMALTALSAIKQYVLN